MRNIKSYDTFNESIKDSMTPKSKQEVLDNTKGNPDITFQRTSNDMFGSRLVGEITLNYNDIVKLFGEPVAEEWIGNNFYWALKTSDNRYITIYDNNSGMESEELMEVDYHWHIGGNSTQDFNDLSYYIYNNIL